MVSRLNPPLSPLNLDEEYNNALRSKSYIDIYSKLHHHNDNQSHSAKAQEEEEEEEEKSQYYEVEHTNQSLVDSLDQEEPTCGRDFRNLLLDFFDTTRQSSDALFSLLSSLSLANSHHRSIHRLLTKLSKSPNCPQLSSSTYYSQLSSQLDHENPLSTKNLITFHAAHGRYQGLIQRLNSANRRIDRRLRIRWLVFLFRECRRRWERVKRRVDGAARGAYIVGRDMDTVSRMVRRVEDEVEHGREVGRMVVRLKKDDDEQWGIVREVVKEIEGRGRGGGGEGEEKEVGLEEQVEELEEHVYLCLITINRSRRMVALDTMVET